MFNNSSTIKITENMLAPSVLSWNKLAQAEICPICSKVTRFHPWVYDMIKYYISRDPRTFDLVDHMNQLFTQIIDR